MNMAGENDCYGCPLASQLERKEDLLAIYSRAYRNTVEYAVNLEDRLRAAEETLSHVQDILLTAAGKGFVISTINNKTYVNYESFLGYYHPTCRARAILRKYRKSEGSLVELPEPTLQEALAIADYVKQVKDWRFVLTTRRPEHMRFISNRAFNELTAYKEKWAKFSKYTRQTFERCVDSLDALDQLDAVKKWMIKWRSLFLCQEAHDCALAEFDEIFAKCKP